MKLSEATAKRMGAAFALVLALAATPSAPAATVSIDVERGSDTIVVRASAVLKVDAATAWRVLTDYDRYVEFIPDLRLSHVVSRHGAIVTVEQSGDVALWALKVPVHIIFEINETAPNRLQSRTVAGSPRAVTSCYELTPVASGIRLDYVGHVTPRFELVGQIEQAALERTVARQFQALADEIERQGAIARLRSVEGAR